MLMKSPSPRERSSKKLPSPPSPIPKSDIWLDYAVWAVTVACWMVAGFVFGQMVEAAKHAPLP